MKPTGYLQNTIIKEHVAPLGNNFCCLNHRVNLISIDMVKPLQCVKSFHNFVSCSNIHIDDTNSDNFVLAQGLLNQFSTEFVKILFAPKLIFQFVKDSSDYLQK